MADSKKPGEFHIQYSDLSNKNEKNGLNHPEFLF